MLDIITIEQSTDNTLTKEAKEVSFPLSFDEEKLILQMKEILRQKKGVGLAAPQVGCSKKIILYHISEDQKALRKDAEIVPMSVLINPSYTPAKDAVKVSDWEGCFSVSSTYGKVPRFNKITLKAQLQDGTFITKEISGFTARVLQHEIDHINGVLIVNRLTPDCIQGKPEEMLKLRFQELNPDQQEIAKRYFTPPKT